MPADDLTLGDIRAELAHLLALADTAERPRPTAINPPDHPMPGHEWTVTEQPDPHSNRPCMWTVRTVDDSETLPLVYASTPESMFPGHDFVAMHAADARSIGLAFLAAADRADHLARGVPLLADYRP